MPHDLSSHDLTHKQQDEWCGVVMVVLNKACLLINASDKNLECVELFISAAAKHENLTHLFLNLVNLRI